MMLTCCYMVFTVMTALGIVPLYMVLAGPTMADRILALELMGADVVGLIVLYSMMNNQPIFIDVALLLAMLSFLSSVAFAYYLEKKGC